MDKQKEMRMAMNGKMCLLSTGIMLIFIAATSTMMYGINMFGVAMEAAKGTEEFVKMLSELDMGIGMVRVMGCGFILVAIMEIFTGISAVRFSNRVDRAMLLKKIIIVLLIVEVAMQVFLFFMRAMSLGMLFTALAIPLFMFWGVTRLCKLAKEDPERIYAVETAKERQKMQQQAAAAKGKSLRERAMMKASVPERTDAREDVETAEDQDFMVDAETAKDQELLVAAKDQEIPEESGEQEASGEEPEI